MAAKAPKPGQARKKAETEDASKQILRMTLGGRTLDLILGNITLKEKFAIRSATGVPFEAFFGEGEHSFGEDSASVVWWLARRHNGEENLPWMLFHADWATDWANADDFDIESVTDDEEPSDDPEGSGPGS